MVIAKIVSGGQTGVDRGALEAAVELGFPYGGLVPKGRRAEVGVVPETFDQMTEAPFESYVYRTEQNVANSDCTLIISREIEKFKPQCVTGRVSRAVRHGLGCDPCQNVIYFTQFSAK